MRTLRSGRPPNTSLSPTKTAANDEQLVAKLKLRAMSKQGNAELPGCSKWGTPPALTKFVYAVLGGSSLPTVGPKKSGSPSEIDLMLPRSYKPLLPGRAYDDVAKGGKFPLACTRIQYPDAFLHSGATTAELELQGI